MRTLLLISLFAPLLACTPEPVAQSTPPGAAPAGCAAGLPAPQTIDEVVERVDALPERSIPCMVASLPRPLSVMAVASTFSAQPGSWWSPRFFVFTDGLVLSVVPEGEGAHLLELGEWTEPGLRSRKAELVYPLPEGPPDPYTHLALDDGSTCGVCHVLEEAEELAGQFVSDAIEPTLGSRVPLDDVLAEAEACDPEAEPERCGILRAVMGAGDVRDATWPR
jgi:hypothetical protein